MIRMSVLTVVLAGAFALPGVAFELQGFRSCASVAEARAVAARSGLSLRFDAVMPLEDGGEGEGYFVGEGATARIGLVFSDGKLIRASKQLDGGVDAFAATLEVLGDELGQPLTEARAVQQKLSEPISIVMATWSVQGSERKALTLTKVANMVSTSVLDSIDRRECSRRD